MELVFLEEDDVASFYGIDLFWFDRLGATALEVDEELVVVVGVLVDLFDLVDVAVESDAFHAKALDLDV